jgi:hypothetical protein
MKNGSATMFMYSEIFSGKGPNETISFLNYYFSEKFERSVKKIFIFSDNCFAQMKSRYLWFYYKFIVETNIFEEINLIYLIPGHSYLDNDRDFGIIEKSRKNIHKINLPSQWENLVKNARKKNPFKVVFVNFPLTDNLMPDSTPIVTVYDY